LTTINQLPAGAATPNAGSTVEPASTRAVVSDYHLLGNADSAGNLFGGGIRPKKRQESKARLRAGLLEQVGHANLKTTSGYTHFDDAFRQRMARVQGLFSQEDGPNGPKFPDFPSTGRVM
jgi:hypothetical protein